jgi:photosystem II stability/assembly factor-like uncharacterized protein
VQTSAEPVARTLRISQPGVVIGTDSGLFVLTENDAEWTQSAVYLDRSTVTAVAFERPGVVLVATRGQGLFRIDLAAGTTTQLGSNALPLKLRALAVSPQEPRKIYVGTEPAAIFISDDSGESWHESAGVRSVRDERSWKFPSSAWESHIRHIMICADDPRFVFASGQVGGLLRSEDGGANWIEVLAGIDPDVHAVLQHPKNLKMLFLVSGGGGPVDAVDSPTWTPPPLPQGRPFYRSLDRGKTWTCISTDFDRHYGVSMAATSGAAVTLVGAVARDVPPEWHTRAEGADAILVVSRDDGETWEPAGAEGLPSSFGTMIDVIEIDRAHTGRIFIGTCAARNKVHPDLVVRPEVYIGSQADGPWKHLPFEFPGIAAIVPFRQT